MFGFKIGQQVTWEKSDDDIAEGEVGKVVGFKPQKKRIKVQYRKGTYSFKPDQFTVYVFEAVDDDHGLFEEGDAVSFGQAVTFEEGQETGPFEGVIVSASYAGIEDGDPGMDVTDFVKKNQEEGFTVGPEAMGGDPKPDGDKALVVMLSTELECEQDEKTYKAGSVGQIMGFDEEECKWMVKFPKSSGHTYALLTPGEMILQGKGFNDRQQQGAILGDWVQWIRHSEDVPLGTYGQVKSFSGALADVKFGTHLASLPTGELNVKCRMYINSHTGGEDWLMCGDQVSWTRSDDDIAEDEVGTITLLKSVRACIKFDKGKWTFSSSDLILKKRLGWSVDDRVVWSKSDSDIAPGEVGTVARIDSTPHFSKQDSSSIISVEYAKGTWRFRPQDLTEATGDEVEIEADDLSEGYTEKHALLVGCTYLGQKGQLNGVARDVTRCYKWLQEPPLSIPQENIVVLSDDPAAAKSTNACGKPTQANIKKCMRELVEKSGPNTLQFFAYSGHGGAIPGTGESHETEVDNRSGKKKDQALVPIDHRTNPDRSSSNDYGWIRDNWILEKFMLPMHKDSTLFMIADACHSGTIADLPYEFCLEPGPHVKRVGPIIPDCDAFVFSGCRDDQTSADLGSSKGGALTSQLLPLLSGWRKTQEGNPPVEAFLERLRYKISSKGLKQTPVCSSSADMSGSTYLPLDQPRQRYSAEGEARGFDDDVDFFEDDDECLFEDPDADAIEIEGWDEDELGDEEIECEPFEDDEDVWADYVAPTGKGAFL